MLVVVEVVIAGFRGGPVRQLIQCGCVDGLIPSNAIASVREVEGTSGLWDFLCQPL